MTLTHNGHNALADSANPRADLGDRDVEHGGLSTLGRAAIAEMNRLGMLVDVAHVSRDGHAAGCRVLAHAGGVHAFLHPRAVRPSAQPGRRAARRAARRGRRRAGHRGARRSCAPNAKPEAVTVADFADHIDYAVRRIGIAHVGISSDFDGGGWFTGWNDASESPNITAELVRRGYDRGGAGAAVGRQFPARACARRRRRRTDAHRCAAGRDAGAGARPGHLAHGRARRRGAAPRRRRCGWASISA